MKPTITTIERRVTALEIQHGAEQKPIELNVTVTTPEGVPDPNWTSERREWKHNGRNCISTLPRLLTPEEHHPQK